MKETWAFINSGFHDAATNMAIDEALLNWHSKGKIPPAIRFYGWERPSLTIGQFQNERKTIDFEGVKKHGCDFVRRLTGGSAVLHDHEVTYSIIVSEKHSKIPHTINEAYYVLADGLLKGYKSIGIEAELSPSQEKPRGDHSAVCFEKPAVYELVVNGKKLSGNAQTRRKEVLLQHGSLPLKYDTTMLFDLFTFSTPELRDRQRNQFLRKATSIQEQIPEVLEYDDLVPVFLQGFQESLHIETKPFKLPDALWEDVVHLRDTKYAMKTWNNKQKSSKQGATYNDSIKQ